jgi:hypothetical protein
VLIPHPDLGCALKAEVTDKSIGASKFSRRSEKAASYRVRLPMRRLWQHKNLVGSDKLVIREEVTDVCIYTTRYLRAGREARSELTCTSFSAN